MPFLQKDGVFHEGLEDKKYNEIKAEILKLYVFNLENKVYPTDRGLPYPTKRLPLAMFSAAHNGCVFRQ